MFPRTTCVALWVVVIGLLVALFAPFRQAGAGALVAALVILAVIFVFELIRMIARPRPSWIPGNEFQAESRMHRVNDGDLEFIDWEG